MKSDIFLKKRGTSIAIGYIVFCISLFSFIILTASPRSLYQTNKNSSSSTPSISPEVGFTATSPNGENGGFVIPASCPSDLHDDARYGEACSACSTCNGCNSGTYQCSGSPEPGYWGWDRKWITGLGWNWGLHWNPTGTGTPGACSVAPPADPAWLWTACSACNACGNCNSGTYNNCAGNCSVSAPALPAGYGGGCVSVANNCGSTNPGVIGCSGGCNAIAPADIPLGSACSGPANACGMTTPGTMTCAGCNSTVAPSDALCDLAICKNSCNSSLDRTGNFTVASGPPSTTLKACFYDPAASACSGGVDITGSATWTETNAPEDAIYFSPTGVLNARYVNGDETFRVSYLGVTKSPRVTVTCIPNTCSIAPAKTITDTYCPEVTQDTGVPTGCDGMTLVCPGTRKCNYNWREIAP